jgi:hypothetical protein
VQCVGNTDCPAPTPICDTVSHACRCRAPSPGNLLKNPGFDGSFSGWTIFTAVLTADSDLCPASNSGFIDNSENDPQQCISLAPGTYFWGGRFNGGPNESGNFMRIHFSSLPNCADLLGTHDLRIPGGLSTWISLSESFTAPPGTTSASVGVYGLQQYFDQLFVSTSNQF